MILVNETKPLKLFQIKITKTSKRYKETSETVSSDSENVFWSYAEEGYDESSSSVKETIVPETTWTQTQKLDGTPLDEPIVTAEKEHKLFHRTTYKREILSEESVLPSIMEDPSSMYNVYTSRRYNENITDEKERNVHRLMNEQFERLENLCDSVVYFGTDVYGRKYFARPKLEDGIIYLNNFLLGT